jgi:hypothetical protein
MQANPSDRGMTPIKANFGKFGSRCLVSINTLIVRQKFEVVSDG